MAILLSADGSTRPIVGPLTLDHMNLLVGGYIEIVRIGPGGDILIIDESGQLKGKPVNAAATVLYRGDPPRHDGVIVGDAIRCVCTNPGHDNERYD